MQPLLVYPKSNFCHGMQFGFQDRTIQPYLLQVAMPSIGNKTWGNFQDNYYTADQDLRESQLTAQSVGYCSNNVASEETNM